MLKLGGLSPEVQNTVLKIVIQKNQFFSDKKSQS